MPLALTLQVRSYVQIEEIDEHLARIDLHRLRTHTLLAHRLQIGQLERTRLELGEKLVWRMPA